MKHFLMLLWFPVALFIFGGLNGVLASLPQTAINQDFGFAWNLIVFIVSAMTIGELTLLVYKNLYKKV